MRLSECEFRKNNFNCIEFIAALTVIASHAFAVTGRAGHEWLAHQTKGVVSFGALAVSVFFIISGYLVSASYERSGSFLNRSSSAISAHELRGNHYPAKIFLLPPSPFSVPIVPM